MTPDNLIAAHVTTAYDVARQQRLAQGGWIQEAMFVSQLGASGRFLSSPDTGCRCLAEIEERASTSRRAAETQEHLRAPVITGGRETLIAW